MKPSDHTIRVVPTFDFSEALSLTLMERFDRCVARARVLAADYQRFANYPCIPEGGAAETELTEMEASLGRSLPPEYREFLSRCRYLKINDGTEVGGASHEGVYVTERPWISYDDRRGMKYLVFANYWRHAAGDQLMFDLSDPDYRVVAYLHEHGPLYESFAPSFSLALWRLVHEA